MAIKVQNCSRQVVPLIVPGQDGGTQVNLKPRETVVLALTKPTAQIVALKSRGMLKIK